jgi:HEAT repeat protein
MPRPRKSKSVSTEKKFTAIPRQAEKPAATKPSEPILKSTPAIAADESRAVATAAVETPVAETKASEAKVSEKKVAETKPASAAPAVSASASLPALIAALRDADADVAREAATSLGQLGDRNAVEPLMHVLTDSTGYFHCVVRAAAAVALGQLKDTRATLVLISTVNDSIAETSAEAIRALAMLGDRRAIPVLLDVVRDRNGFFVPSVRRAAVLSLASFGGAEALAELRMVAANESEDTVIRAEAAKAVNAAAAA